MRARRARATQSRRTESTRGGTRVRGRRRRTTAAATTRTTRAASLGHGTHGRFIHQRTSDWISDLHANRRRGQGCALRGLPRRMGGARTSGHRPRLRNLHTDSHHDS
jgi:hypothetical protein